MLTENGWSYTSEQVDYMLRLMAGDLNQVDKFGLAVEIERAQHRAYDNGVSPTAFPGYELPYNETYKNFMNSNPVDSARTSCSLLSNYITIPLMGMLGRKYLVKDYVPTYAEWLVACIREGAIKQDPQTRDYVYQADEMGMSTPWVRGLGYEEHRRTEHGFNSDMNLLWWAAVYKGFPFFEVRLSQSATDHTPGHTVVYLRTETGDYKCLDGFHPKWNGTLLAWEPAANGDGTRRFGPGKPDTVHIVSTVCGHHDAETGRLAWMTGGA